MKLNKSASRDNCCFHTVRTLTSQNEEHNPNSSSIHAPPFQIRFMMSKWDHTIPKQYPFLHALDAFNDGMPCKAPFGREILDL